MPYAWTVPWRGAEQLSDSPPAKQTQFNAQVLVSLGCFFESALHRDTFQHLLRPNGAHRFRMELTAGETLALLQTFVRENSR